MGSGARCCGPASPAPTHLAGAGAHGPVPAVSPAARRAGAARGAAGRAVLAGRHVGGQVAAPHAPARVALAAQEAAELRRRRRLPSRHGPAAPGAEAAAPRPGQQAGGAEDVSARRGQRLLQHAAAQPAAQRRRHGLRAALQGEAHGGRAGGGGCAEFAGLEVCSGSACSHTRPGRGRRRRGEAALFPRETEAPPSRGTGPPGSAARPSRAGRLPPRSPGLSSARGGLAGASLRLPLPTHARPLPSPLCGFRPPPAHEAPSEPPPAVARGQRMPTKVLKSLDIHNQGSQPESSPLGGCEDTAWQRTPK